MKRKELLEKAPKPIRVLVNRDALSKKQLEQLLRLEQLYPPEAIDDRWTSDLDPNAISLDGVMALWREKRPETNPPAPIWKCSREAIAQSPELPTLLDSYQSLLEYVRDRQGTIPQWVTAAWWWGCAAIACKTSVSQLQEAIDGWANRYKSAILYLQSQEFQREPETVDAYHADLRYSNSENLPQHLDQTWAIRSGFEWGAWHLPSSMQPWGTRAQQGKTVMERDRQQQQ